MTHVLFGFAIQIVMIIAAVHFVTARVRLVVIGMPSMMMAIVWSIIMLWAAQNFDGSDYTTMAAAIAAAVSFGIFWIAGRLDLYRRLHAA